MENNEKELELMNENENREFYVYKHIRKDNNTCFYVGKGKANRIKVPKRNKHFNRIRKKYGCYVVKIKENLTEKEAFALEREIIEDYVFVFGYGINIDGYRDYDHEYLTNCTWGGEGTSGYKFSEESKRKIGEKNKVKNKGKKHSEETKQIISEKVSGEKNGMFGKKGEKNPMYGKNPFESKTEEEMEEIRRKKSESMKGKMAGEKNPMWGKPSWNKGKKGLFHHSEESKSKIGESHKGKKHSEETKKKMSENSGRKQKTICVTTGEKFDSIKDASDHYNINQSSIAACCRKERKHAGKLNGERLQWKFLENDDNESKAV